MSKAKVSKRKNGLDGGFITTEFEPLKNGVSEWTLYEELNDFREMAADILMSYGKLDDEQCQRAKQGDLTDILKLKFTDDDPKVCHFAKAMLNGIHSVDYMSGLDSTKTELLLIAKLVNVAYFLGIGRYEDEIVKGVGISNGVNKTNRNKAEHANMVKEEAQKLADKAWSKKPELSRVEVARKILKDLPLTLNGERYSVSHVAKRFIKKKKE
ncbi:hypothetical protein WB881_001418 [Vibrio parahaemolyticus]|uniref:hypothetical protein n=1 Tax=Vibrio parahaemolyticus TaxID=670 RepID=UPI00112058AC|nr:hypothetical protein [Vibrio parahaemolyticus]TNZ93002.1 hypothetical protein CGK37_10485 [Vibrio parahaemolyticus]TOA14179.1 hypothetical protein CGK34_10880 [Vibrio parahaemolyticus]